MKHDTTAKLYSKRSIIYIQVIRTIWTKVSRGGRSAVLRNALPEVCSFPSLDEEKYVSSYAFHEIEFFPERSPGPPSITTSPFVPITEEKTFHVGSARIHIHHDYVRADIAWHPHYGGAPPRYDKQNALELKKDEWGQIKYNNRHSSAYEIFGEFSEWWYEKYVFNIALLSTPYPDVFVKTRPTYMYDRMDNLR